MENIDKIERYLDGKMPEPERQSFEAELASNPALAEELDALRLAREAVELSIGDSLRDQLLQWQEAEAPGSKSEEAKVVKMAPRRSLRRVLAIAASVLLLLAVGSFWYANDRYSANELAMGYYNTTQLEPDRSNSSTTPPLNEGIEALKSGKLPAAEAYFRNIPSTDENYLDARYYLGHSLYRQGKSEEALSALGEVTKSPNPNLGEAAEWLMVLTHLQAGQSGSNECRALLTKMVSDTDHAFHPQAMQLNKQLDSFWYMLAN